MTYYCFELALTALVVFLVLSENGLAKGIRVNQLAKELGVDFGFQMSASAVFREIADHVPAYADSRYPLLKDETKPVQVKHAIAPQRDLSNEIDAIRSVVEGMDESSKKIEETPLVGHELFKLGTLTDKVPQFHLLAAGNPKPETFRISPLYQITLDASLREAPHSREAGV